MRIYNKWIDPASGSPITAHGFRATFRTWAKEVATVPHAVIEQAMGHQVGGQVERAYRRTDVLDQRRKLMEAWAQWCEPKADSNVIAFGKASRSCQAGRPFYEYFGSPRTWMDTFAP